MASVKRRPDRGNRWEVRYRDPDGKQRAQLFDRKVDADRFANTTEAKKLRGEWIDPAAGKVTFREYAKAWQAIQVHRESTANKVDSVLRNHVLPYVGDRPMNAIRPTEMQAWAKGRADDPEIAASTLEVVFKYVKAIFNAAVADRIIARPPLDGVKVPKPSPTEVVPPTVEQVQAIAAAVPERYRALITLTAGTGPRQGEAFGVTVDRIDFLRRTLKVDRQVVLLRQQRPKFGPLKTEASYRTIPLPQVVIDALAEHLRKYPAAADGLVFTDNDGQMLDRSDFNKHVWLPAVAKAKVEATFHDLRHFYASLLIRHGESVKVVQKRLGHASVTQTLDTYGHLWPDSDDQTRAAVDEVLDSTPSAPDVHHDAASDA